jgi:ribonuclease P/MRP protein subunit POP1
MVEDKTPTVTARRRKLTGHTRLRLETSKKLRALGVKQKAQKRVVDAKEKDAATDVAVGAPDLAPKKEKPTAITARIPRVKKATLAAAPVPKAKFRKRQINKTWLPTHMFHAKRARMSPPTDPLWRFAIPMTPTAKCYRPTHRAANERGAIAWDVSYMSTLGLDGQQNSIEGVLKAVGVGSRPAGENLWSRKGQKWRNGTRVWEGVVFEREDLQMPIAPVTVIWSALDKTHKARNDDDPGKRKRKVIIRVHPSAFPQLWDELVRLSKVAKPQISIEDLRFQIGSIEVTGPASTEALLGALWPSPPATSSSEHAKESVESTWQALGGLTNQAGLPVGTLLAFDVQDPRLHHPPRTIKIPDTAEDHQRLLELLTTWPVDSAQSTPSLFDKQSRVSASAKLQSQKAINRRKTLAAPGQFPKPVANDPRIPSLLYCTSTANGKQGKWTLLLPWKCVQPVWYSVMYYPLSTGGQPRFGGIMEKRQLSFETGTPCFPEDFPGTKAGLEWETQERERRHAEWKRRPKSKRVNWDVVDLGEGRKGEIGEGWACDWQRLVNGPPMVPSTVEDAQAANDAAASREIEDPTSESLQPLQLTHHSPAEARALLSSVKPSDPLTNARNPLANVRITLLTRGVPQACARIYRLPSTTAAGGLRQRWLALHPSKQAQVKQRGPKNSLPRLSKNTSIDVMQQRLSQSLLSAPKVGDSDYPVCPHEEDLIGFVTSGNFNLGEGQGTGVGSILLERVHGDGDESRVCIVRNAGTGVGRLARWDIV